MITLTPVLFNNHYNDTEVLIGECLSLRFGLQVELLRLTYYFELSLLILFTTALSNLIFLVSANLIVSASLSQS